MKKPIRIGLNGCGFMGRTHSNASSQLSHFFDTTHDEADYEQRLSFVEWSWRE